MSLKTSASMPVENYSVIQQSENGTQFGPNNKIRFRVGSHLGYIDFHTSYLQFNLEVKNAKGKMEFANGMGADILIRTWRLLIGGHIIEEIDHPNVLLKVMKYDYGRDLGMREITEVLDKSGKGTGYQGLNKIENVDVATDSPCAVVKCILDLKFSGIFGSTQTFPVGMTGDVEIEITLEDQRRCFQVVQSGYLPRRLTTNNHISNGVSIDNLPNGAGLTSVQFKADSTNDVDIMGKNVSLGTLSDCPFSIGQAVRLTGEQNSAQYNKPSTGLITAIDINGTDTRLTVAAADPGIVHASAVAEASVGFRDEGFDLTPTAWDNGGTLTYEVSVPSLVLQVVVPPPLYVSEQARKVATEGYSIDVPTYTCYKTNTYAGVKSATIEIPCYSSRARSLLCIGVEGSQALGGNNYLLAPYRFNGLYDDLHQYQFQIGEEREPVRPVDCGNLSTYQHNVAQEQLTELEKALRSAGCDVRSLKEHRNNFVIGRALSAYGGSIPLTMKGARVYIDYLGTNKRDDTAVSVVEKQWFNYCAHIRRLNITPQGVSVMY